MNKYKIAKINATSGQSWLLFLEIFGDASERQGAELITPPLLNIRQIGSSGNQQHEQL
jgi:hypothetical protein